MGRAYAAASTSRGGTPTGSHDSAVSLSSSLSPVISRTVRALAYRLPPVQRLVEQNEALTRRVRRSRARQRRLREQRDRARARVRALQWSGRHLDYLFIVTYGRSGSTLLQGILNSIPGYVIRGENGQVVRHLYEFDRTAREMRDKRRRWLRGRDDHDGELPVTHPFHGIDRYPRGRVRRDLRRLLVDNVLGPGPDARVTGFKEVRWTEPDTPQLVNWLRSVFPGARFIVNTRDLDDVARSGWWGERDGSREELERIDAMLRQIALDLGDAAYHLHYDDYVDDTAALRGLFEWLGEDFDPDRAREVLAVRHSFDLPVQPPSDEGGPADA
jgi:hypothetical protein